LLPHRRAATAAVLPIAGELLMLRLLPLSLLVFVLTAVSHAQAQHIDRVEIVEWGIFRHEQTGVRAAPLAATGKTNLVTNVRIQHVTTTIPALVGMKFGFRFTVVGSPPGALVNLKCVTRFPSQGLTNPQKGKTFSSSEFHSSAVIGVTTYRGYGFDYDWEVEPGPRTLEIWHNGRKLAEKTFMVTRLVSSAEQAGTVR
jgi:hypothetical protein